MFSESWTDLVFYRPQQPALKALFGGPEQMPHISLNIHNRILRGPAHIVYLLAGVAPSLPALALAAIAKSKSC